MRESKTKRQGGSDSSRLSRFTDFGAGLCIILFPIMLLAGFATHPDILSLKMVTDLNDWIAEWRGSFWFHMGHLLVMFAVPLIIVACYRILAMLDGDHAWYRLIGGTLGVFGAFMLAVDKGALTFVLTAFWQMPKAEFTQITPALDAIFRREGWLALTWGFVVLPIGFVVLAVGLLKQGVIPGWQASAAIVGLLLLLNPDIEIISSFGAALICVGLIPLGLRVARGFGLAGLCADACTQSSQMRLF